MDEGEITVRLVRIEERIDGLRQAITFGDNSSAALVTLVRGEVEHMNRDITTMGNLNREAHTAFQAQIDMHSVELDTLKAFQSKLIGMGFVLTLGTGVVTALTVKALGG